VEGTRQDFWKKGEGREKSRPSQTAGENLLTILFKPFSTVLDHFVFADISGVVVEALNATDTRHKVTACGVGIDSATDFGADSVVRNVVVVNESLVDTAEEHHVEPLLVEFLLDFGDIVGGENALPHIDAHFSEVDGDRLDKTVAVVLDENASAVDEIVKPFIMRLEEFAEFLRREEHTLERTEVVVAVNHIDIGYVIKNLGEDLEFPVGVSLVEFVDGFGFFVHIDKDVLKGFKGVETLKEAAEAGNHGKVASVFSFFNETFCDRPVEVLRDFGEFNVIAPFSDVFNDFVVIVGERYDTRVNADDIAVSDAPVIEVTLAGEL